MKLDSDINFTYISKSIHTILVKSPLSIYLYCGIWIANCITSFHTCTSHSFTIIIRTIVIIIKIIVKALSYIYLSGCEFLTKLIKASSKKVELQENVYTCHICKMNVLNNLYRKCFPAVAKEQKDYTLSYT